MHLLRSAFILSALLSVTACGDPAATLGDTGEPGPEGIAVLGGYTHDIGALEVSVIATADDGLNLPRDLAFNPDAPEQLWIVNRADDSVVIVTNPGADKQESTYEWSIYGEHFLAQPSALAFGASGTFATAHEEDDYTQGNATPPDFMGPTLWTSDLEEFDAGHHGHLDMLHNSPNAVGIAWEADNIYWVFDGYHTSLTRYDFQSDHGLGGADHTDGIVERFVEGEVGYEPDVPSHMVYDPDTRWLFVADTANARIAALDTQTGELGARISPSYDGSDQNQVDGASLWTVVDGAESGLSKPSGLELRDRILYTTDNQTGTIYAFNLDGMLLDWLETGLPAGALMGIAFDEAGQLYLVDAVNDQVLRIAAAQ